MKTDYQKKLALKNPTISLNTEYFYDEDADWTIFNSGKPMEQEVPANWICWRVEVSASIIDAGYLMTTTAHLGSLWHEHDSPHDRCGDYEFDLIEQALAGLLVKVMGSKTSISAIQRLIADNANASR